jgi:hypothetical protein
MNLSEQLAALADLAESLGVEIRRAPAGDRAGPPGSAAVRLKGREIVFLDAYAAVAERIGVLASALAKRRELDGVFLPPQIRELIEHAE